MRLKPFIKETKLEQKKSQLRSRKLCFLYNTKEVCNYIMHIFGFLRQTCRKRRFKIAWETTRRKRKDNFL